MSDNNSNKDTETSKFVEKYLEENNIPDKQNSRINLQAQIAKAEIEQRRELALDAIESGATVNPDDIKKITAEANIAKRIIEGVEEGVRMDNDGNFKYSPHLSNQNTPPRNSR